MSDKSLPKAVGKVLVSGQPCGMVLMTKQFNTSTLRYHLNAKHPAIFKKVVSFEQAWDDARSRAMKYLSKFFYVVRNEIMIGHNYNIPNFLNVGSLFSYDIRLLVNS